MGIQFGISPINWTNDDDPNLGWDIPLQQCLREMVEAGFSGCEIGNKFPKDIENLRSCVAPYNLQITTDWIGTRLTEEETYDDTIRQFQNKVSFLSSLGVQALKVCECGHSIQNTARPILRDSVSFTSVQWKLLIKGLHEMGHIAKNAGCYIAYHPHLGTGIQDEAELERLMKETDPNLVSLLPDTGHLYAAHIDPLSVFVRYYERIKYIHLKDVRLEMLRKTQNNQWSFMDAVRGGLFTVPGDGCIDFAPIFQLLLERNFSGWLIVEAEQDPTQANPLAYAKKSRAFLREYFNC